jgi:hypothetical protein
MSPLSPEQTADFDGLILAARRECADAEFCADRPRIAAADAAFVGVLARAMRAVELCHGCATEEQLQALGFTAEELARHGAAAAREAAHASVRLAA